MTRCARVLFVNSGLLGHRSVATLLADAVRAGGSGDAIEARHVDAGAPRHLVDRLVRRVACASIAPASGPFANMDVARWRREWHTGFAARRRIEQVLGGWMPDVLHFHTQAAAYGSLALMRQVPAIVSIDCTQTLARDEMRGVPARASYGPNIRRDRAVFEAARAIVATSRWAARDLQRTCPAVAARVRVMPYPVRLPPACAQWIEERHASAGHRPCRFLFVGGDFPRKGGFDLLHAWRDAGLDGHAELQIATSWPIEPSRLPRGVTVARGIEAYSAGWRERWRRADVFVMPTRAEAFGMVFQEAAAAGLPVIATRINAIPEIVDHEGTGVLVPPGDAAALVTAIRRLAADAGARRDMGARARQRAVRQWSLAGYARELSATVGQCMNTELAAP